MLRVKRSDSTKNCCSEVLAPGKQLVSSPLAAARVFSETALRVLCARLGLRADAECQARVPPRALPTDTR